MAEKIQTSTSMGSISVIQKFHTICAYQFELGYDLAIAIDNNVSESPGFENLLVLGIHGGRQR